MANLTATPKSRFFQPLDRTAIVLILILSLLIGGLLLKGDRTAAKVRSFSWQDRQVGAEDTAFILAFNRPMDHESVEQNLQINPPLPGKISWAGRRMAYTLTAPVPYGKSFELTLDTARDRFSQADDPRTQMQPFNGQFRTRDRAFVYLGVSGEEAGRLILANLTRQEQRILTPKNLVVMDFQSYPNGDRILFSATDRSSQTKGLLDQQLYTVTTGIEVQAPAANGFGLAPDSTQPIENRPAGEMTLVLNSKEYQNLKFDLSPDGQTIAIQRVKRNDPGDYGLWLLKTGAKPEKVNADPGGNFLITPDSQTLAMSQGQGMAILPLAKEAPTLDFLPKYGVVLNFAKDGSAAAMVKFNVDPTNPTRSLFLVTNQGVEKEILNTDGSILEAAFDPTKTNLYCLYTKRLPGDVYEEEPYIAAINLKTYQVTDLLQLPIQRDIQLSLAPDGVGILFDQVVTDGSKNPSGAIRSREGKAITNGQLWLLPLLQDDQGKVIPADPQPLQLAGLRPRWLP
ncbi:MAG: hypothetical protein EDM05_57140 [Leptolyngbya sp. IPPAS B-1204]|nr:MAG: hypothetical protein EDM05_08690 [Leptolyngbya sp. IPPAS B-1204]